MRLRRETRLPVAGIAIAGVVAGHALTYLVAVRQPVHRMDILDATGHSYWTVAIAIAIALGFVGTMAVGLRAILGAPEAREEHRFAHLAPRLAAGQVIAYITIELVERLLSGVPVANLLDHHDLLPVGVAIQLAVALCGAFLLHVMARTLRFVADALRTTHHRHASTPPAPATHLPLRSRALRGAWGLRGPPVTLSPVAGL